MNPSGAYAMQTDPQKPDESIIVTQESQEEDSVHVVYGIHAYALPLIGQRVHDARELCSQFNPIHPDAVPILEGEPVSEDSVLASGQWLAFIRHRGEMGP